MNVLVSGNKGFIATYLIEELSKIPEIKIHGFEKEDDPYDYKDIKYDYIFHFAAVARSMEVDMAPFDAHEDNVELTIKLLRDFEYDNFIYASSCAVYGNNPIELKEEGLVDPFCIYASQKLASEKYVDFYSKLKNRNSVCLRFFNVYGEGQSELGSYPNVIAALIKSYKSEGYIVVDGDGKQTRDFIHVRDIVSGVIKSMDLEGNHIINLCTTRETSIQSVGEMIVRGDLGKIKYGQPRRFDIRYQKGNNELARNLLKWEPEIDLETGIKNLLENEQL